MLSSPSRFPLKSRERSRCNEAWLKGSVSIADFLPRRLYRGCIVSGRKLGLLQIAINVKPSFLRNAGGIASPSKGKSEGSWPIAFNAFMRLVSAVFPSTLSNVKELTQGGRLPARSAKIVFVFSSFDEPSPSLGFDADDIADAVLLEKDTAWMIGQRYRAVTRVPANSPRNVLLLKLSVQSVSSDSLLEAQLCLPQTRIKMAPSCRKDRY